MKDALKLMVIIVLAVALLALAGCSLYKHFVTDQIKDGGGGMENPDATADGMELIKFSWQQSHGDSSRCFTLDFCVEDEMPAVSGSFQSRSNDEVLQTGSDTASKTAVWPLTWVQWFDLQHTLAAMELPEYQSPSSEALNETDSRIVIVWRDGDEEKTMTLDGSGAEMLEEQVLNLAQNAYDASKSESD